MSLNKHFDDFSDEERMKIEDDLVLELKSSIPNVPPKTVITYNLDNQDILALPFAYAIKYFNMKHLRPTRDSLPSTFYSFTKELRPEQKVVKAEVIKTMNKTGSGMISAYCGYGKTCCAINIASTIKLKTLIIVNKLVLINQWAESIDFFCEEATYQKVKTKSKKEDCDFYIINAQNVEKMGREYFEDVGLVVVDEAHNIMAETLSRSLHHITPRYLLGLSATPYRPDELNVLIDYYFGTEKVIRELNREHHVYKIETGIKYKIEKTIDGRLNWGNLLDQQSEHAGRNAKIVEIVVKERERNFLILVKRVKQGELLMNMLQEAGEDVTSLLGSNQEFDRESRILIGTCQKVGVGFDHKKMDALILAADIEEYFIQYLGRVFRTKEKIPIIFDLVDNQGTLKKHFSTRENVYKKHGGVFKKYQVIQE